MNIQGYIRVPLERKGADGKDGKDGADGVSVIPSTNNIIFTEGVDEMQVTIRAYKGDEVIYLTESMVELSDTPTGVAITLRRNSITGRLTMTVTREEGLYVSGLVSYTITIDEQTFAFTLGIITATDSLIIIPSTNTIAFTAGDTEKSFTVTAYKGGQPANFTRADVEWIEIPDNLTNEGFPIQNNVMTVTIAVIDTSQPVTGNLAFTITIDGQTFTFSLGVYTVTDGKGIKEVIEWYGLSNGAHTIPDEWVSDPTSLVMDEDNKYLWNKEEIQYTDGSSFTTSAVVIGVYGVPGADGVGIESIKEWYALSETPDVPTDPSLWTEDWQQITNEKKYLWNVEVINYTKGEPYITYPAIIGAYGDKGDTGEQGEPGADAPHIETSTDTLVFADSDTTLTATARTMIGGDSTDITLFRVNSMPSGWNISPDVNGNVITITVTRTASSANAEFVYYVEYAGTSETKTLYLRIVKDGEPGEAGENALYADIEGSWQIVFTDDFNESIQALYLYFGTDIVDPSEYSVEVSNNYPASNVRAFLNGRTEGTRYLNVLRSEPYDPVENCSFEVTFTYGSIVRTKTVTVSSTASGEPGADAIYYELITSTDTFHYNGAAGAYSPTEITIQVQKVEGNSREYVEFAGNVQYDTYTTAISATTSYTFTPEAAYSMIRFTIRPTENTRAQLEKTIYPTTSTMPRCQYWADCEDDFNFEDGTVGCTYTDIVINPKGTIDPSYYVCVQKHTKSADTEPTGNGNAYWTKITHYKYLATDLLLATEAKIDNLYVDDLYLEGDKTAVWINANHDGVKINKIDNITGERQVSDWGNPTTWLHGDNIPEPSERYGGDGKANTVNTQILSGVTPIRTNTSGTPRDAGSTPTLIGSTVSRSDFSQNVQTTLTFGPYSGTGAFTLLEGSDESVTGNPGNESRANIELRMATSVANLTTNGAYTRLQRWIINGDKEDVTTTLYINSFSVSVVPTAATMYFGLYLTLWDLRLNAEVAFSGNFYLLTMQAISEGYISQYGANGLFIGQKSDTYFRAKVGAEDDTEYDMLAGGTGITITNGGSMQRVNGTAGSSVMPLGGLVATAYFNGSSAYAWAFDGSTIHVTKVTSGSTITSYVDLPSAWSDIFGTFTSSRLLIQVTAANASYPCFFTTNNSNQSGYWRRIAVNAYNQSVTSVDQPIFVNIYYMSEVQTTSGLATLSVEAEKLQVEQDS